MAINAIATSFLQSEGASTSIDGRVTKQIILHDSCFGLTASSGTDCMITKLIQKAKWFLYCWLRRMTSGAFRSHAVTRLASLESIRHKSSFSALGYLTLKAYNFIVVYKHFSYVIEILGITHPWHACGLQYVIWKKGKYYSLRIHYSLSALYA